MLLSFLLYGIAFVLLIYIVVRVARTGEFKTAEAIASLGIVVSIILALRLTPPSITPTQTSAQPAVAISTTLYDDFNNSAFNGGYDLEKWIIDRGGGKIYQQDGVLTAQVDSSMGDGVSLSAINYQNIKIETPMFFEAKLMIKEPINGHIFLYLGSSSSPGIFSDCTLGYGDVTALLDCGYVVNGITEYRQDDKLVNFTTWHTVRIEVEPETMTLTYYLDGQNIHSFIPSNSAQLKSDKFTLQIGIVSDDKKSWTGFIDDVSVGQIP